MNVPQYQHVRSEDLYSEAFCALAQCVKLGRAHSWIKLDFSDVPAKESVDFF